MFCPTCGAVNAETNRFCLGCGTSLAVSPPLPVESPAPAPSEASQAAGQAPGTQLCPLCGKRYEDGLRFCEDDGKPLVAVGQAPAEAAAVKPSPVVPPPPPPPTPPQVATEAADGLAQDGIICPTCGLNFAAGTRFCDQDGTPLDQTVLARPRVAEEPEPAFDEQHYAESWDDEEPREKRRWPLFTLVIAGLLAGGAGYAYYAGLLDRWVGKGPDPELVEDGKSAGSGEMSPKVSPGLSGQYTAHLMDQDITLVVAGDKPLPLVNSAGEITYVNTVNGGSCTAALVPVKGGGVGGDTSNAVSFTQTPVPGKTACPADIPVKMDISGESPDSAGIVGSIKVEWHSPKGDRTLMAGALVRQMSK